MCNDEQITRKLVQKDELLMFDLMDNLLGVQSFGELNKDMPTTLFVTDADGNILISNKFTALTVGMSLEELLRCNVRDLVEDGVYNDSVTLEAIRTKQKKTKSDQYEERF